MLKKVVHNVASECFANEARWVGASVVTKPDADNHGGNDVGLFLLGGLPVGTKRPPSYGGFFGPR